MKFAINAVASTSRARLGTLNCLKRLPDMCLETPALFLYSKGGCIPHLTLDVLELVTGDPFCVQLPLSTTISSHEVLQKFNHGIANFIGMKHNVMYCTVQDPATSTPLGHSMSDKVPIWGRAGKEIVDAERYMDIMEAFHPDIYQSLGDGETNINSTNKRIQKSITRSLDMFNKCMERHQKSEVLKNSGFLALLQGGYDISSRIKYAKEIAQTDVDGFVIDGLHGNGEGVELIEFEKAKSVIRETVNVLPENKFRIVHGSWSPEAVLQMVEEGIDAFDSSFPFIVTERTAALTFPYKPLEEFECSSSNNSGSSVVPKLDSSENPDALSTEELKYEMNLYNVELDDDFRPILKGCSCYCCTQHTRAYVYHLLNNNDFLGLVLLMMHNLHHYLEFFKEIRRALKEDRLESLKATVSKGKIV